MSKGKTVLTLFLTFLKIGAFTFGGGYAMIALLEEEFVGRRKWLTHEEFLDIIAIGESTPGPLAINSATFIGYRQAGFFGSLCSTLGVVIPSVIIITVISLFFDRFMQFRYVQYAFEGIRACVVYLIFSAGLRMFKGLKKKPITYVIFGVVAALFISFYIFGIGFSSVICILACGCVGLFVYALASLKKPVLTDKTGESENETRPRDTEFPQREGGAGK
ncbi:MAG: chromate transporter [Lachnospiraceae bacterium]|nr:chromate transporter [Lachnospiraceae bacterium]